MTVLNRYRWDNGLEWKINMKYDHALGSYLYQTPMSMEQKVGADGYSTKGLDGTLNPYEHGECYVTVDGHEADLDLGHYERFLGIQTTKANNITTGRIYKSVIDKERRGDYLGKTIQVIPHITDEIKRNVKLLGNKYKFDFVITEIGGNSR